MDRVSEAAPAKPTSARPKQNGKEKKAREGAGDGDQEDDGDPDREALQQSTSINDAMQLAANLWSRSALPLPADALDTRSNSMAAGDATGKSSQGGSGGKTKLKDNHKLRAMQARAYREYK